MPSDDKFLELLNQLTHAHTLQMDAAYERGREAGRREVMKAFKEKLSGLTNMFADANEEEESDDIGPDESMDGSDGDVGTDAEGRAPAGSVKPAILKLIAEQPGLTTAGIKRVSNIKPNSIRGTLWALKRDAEVEWREGRWYPVAQTNEAVSEMSVRDAPTASVGEGSALFD